MNPWFLVYQSNISEIIIFIKISNRHISKPADHTETLLLELLQSWLNLRREGCSACASDIRVLQLPIKKVTIAPQNLSHVLSDCDGRVAVHDEWPQEAHLEGGQPVGWIVEH